VDDLPHGRNRFLHEDAEADRAETRRGLVERCLLDPAQRADLPNPFVGTESVEEAREAREVHVPFRQEVADSHLFIGAHPQLQASLMFSLMHRFAAANPFLTAGLIGVLLFGIWLASGLEPGDGGLGQALFYAWRILAAPVHLATNVLGPLTNHWPDALDGGAAVVVGLFPYVMADALWRRGRRRRAPWRRAS
jgi:hypothetical protein